MTIKLLIVEDETSQQQAFLSFFRKEIKAKEYELVFTKTGEEALEIITKDKEKKIDLLIADLRMPAAKINGWQLIKTLISQHINLKVIVVTAWGKLEDFTAEERKNIFFFLNRKESSLSKLKSLVEASLQLPEQLTIHSKRVGFNTLKKFSKDLPSRQKLQLIEDLIPYLKEKELRQLQNRSPELIHECLSQVAVKEQQKKWLIEKVQFGLFCLPIPIEDLDYFYIDSKKKDSYGPYYYLRYWWEGALRSTYLGKEPPPFC
jgi:CheY-like chemotaxis protein